MINAKALALMKNGVMIINTGRGRLIQTEDLIEALKSGKVGSAGLDVYEDEPRLAPGLAGLDNVVLLPHLGSATVETRGRMAVMAVESASAAVRGSTVPHMVNPEVLSRMMGP